jgi:hypothetical protein
MRRLALALLALVAAAGCEHVARVRPLRAVSAAGDAPGYRLWWVEDLLFEAPDGWKATTSGTIFRTWNASDPDCERRRFQGKMLYSPDGPFATGRCSGMFVGIVDHLQVDEASCWEKVVIVRASGRAGPHVDLREHESTFAGARAFVESFAEGLDQDRYRVDRYLFCRGARTYEIGFARPEDDAARFAPGWARLVETARFAPPGAEPKVSGSTAE